MTSKISHVLFALLIFMAHLNCVVEHQLFGTSVSRVSASGLDSGEMPDGNRMPADSEECEHGCICKGATLAPHFVFATGDDQMVDVHFLSPPLAGIAYLCLPVETHFRTATRVCCLPLRALDRCVALQTFLN